MTGFNLSAHRSDPRDIVNGHSTYTMVHKPGSTRKAWRFVPVDITNNLYHIVLAFDDVKEGGTDQTGWFLTVHRYQDRDKRNPSSTFVMLRNDGQQSKTFKIVPNGKYYEISLAPGSQRLDGIDQTGWVLSVHRNQDSDKRNGDST